MVLVRRRRPLLGLGPGPGLHRGASYLGGEGHRPRRGEDGRTFDVDFQLPLKPPSRKQKEPPRRIFQRVPLTTNNGVENMDNLQSLQEASILDNIQHRFRMDLIYTNTGPILIAMNPFKCV